jgi:hypothetical protein
MKYLLLFLISFNCFAITEKESELNLKECGYEDSREFILDKNIACVDVNAWDYCPETGVRHFNGMCDTMSQDDFLDKHEEVD